jgi:hypothetical protein
MFRKTAKHRKDTGIYISTTATAIDFKNSSIGLWVKKIAEVDIFLFETAQ